VKRIDLQPAYVLHTRPYRDTSALVDLLSLDHGLLRAVARGVRGKSAGRRAAIQAFQPLLVSLAGRGELLSLSQAEHAAPGFRLLGDRLFSAMYLNELLMRLLHAQEAQPGIYRLYQQALVRLQQHGSLEACLRCFEFRLLEELGYAWDLQHDARTGEMLTAEQIYLFDPEHGYEAVQAPEAETPQKLFSGKELIGFADVVVHASDDDADSRQAAKRLMRQALRPHIGAKPLLSRTLFAAKHGSRQLPDADTTSGILPPEDNTG
jgi:DNA repair protein RecO (recombination protein O)